MEPFVVFSLPRSRSAWLSAFLSRPGALVGHDIGIECAKAQDFADMLSGPLAGTCETGAAFAWRLIRQMLPEARFVVIQRPVNEVLASLARFGLTGLEDEMEERAFHLEDIAAQPGVMSLRYEQLADPFFGKGLYEFCTGVQPDEGWWAHMDGLNVQVDMERHIRRLIERQPQIAALKADVARRMAHG